MKTLHLTLKKKWFQRHLEDKPEDYRAITPYWVQRLLQMRSGDLINAEDAHDVARDLRAGCYIHGIEARDYDVVQGRNGYSTTAPMFRKEYQTVEIDIGNPKWGAPAEPVFIIRCGKVLETKNCERL